MVAIEEVIAVARAAGDAAMKYLKPDIVVHMKPDNTPYTAADIAANEKILEGLSGIDNSIPILSEEDPAEVQQKAFRLPRRWVVDPLDGSRTAISYAKGKKDHTGFGVHIALFENNVPVQGVIYFPAKGDGGVLYYTGNDGNAYRQEGTNPPRILHASRPPLREPLRAAVTWREDRRPKQVAGRVLHCLPEVGGGRVCSVISGDADIACIEQPFRHWDLAAADVILKKAGGRLVTHDTHQIVNYDNPELTLPPCYAGSIETLKLLGLGKDLPKQGKILG